MGDGKKVILINGKCEKLLRNKKNPRKITWTILYRRKHKKGTMTEFEARKRSGRKLKTQRGVTPLSLRLRRRRRKVPTRRRRPPRPASRRTRRAPRAPAESVARGKRTCKPTS